MSVTDSTKNSAAGLAGDIQPSWLGGIGLGSIRARIMAVNLLAVVVLGLALLYLDSIRTQLLDARQAELTRQAVTVATLVSEAKMSPAATDAMFERLNFERGTRVRLYAADGALEADNWRGTDVRRFRLADPTLPGWRRQGARAIDRAIEFVTGVAELPPYAEPAHDVRSAWPAAEAAARQGAPVALLRRAPEGAIIVTAAAPVHGTGETVHVTEDAADLVTLLRQQREISGWLFLGVAMMTVALTWYLIDTVVRPLRMLALAALRVRLGRSREVTVPRLPDRGDEIGALARALSDMTTSLRQRIDATESFAADVAHELKNPLASLRSAVDTLDQVEAPELRRQLTQVARDDVARLDRLITDIAAASRLDAELSRARWELLDMGELTGGLVEAYHRAGLPEGLAIAFSQPEAGVAMVRGDDGRLMQVLRNLIDNAISFSPLPGLVMVSAQRQDDQVILRVEDEGPGVPEGLREAIFQRFYSERPESEDFGRHSGLGLSIARAITEAHGGTVVAGDRAGGPGACFTVTLPAA